MKSPVLVNAAAMARKHPETFQLPDTAHVAPGSIVKICIDNAERFWVVVEERRGDLLAGRVDSMMLSRLKYGDRIKFHTDNIYEIYE